MIEYKMGKFLRVLSGINKERIMSIFIIDRIAGKSDLSMDVNVSDGASFCKNCDNRNDIKIGDPVMISYDGGVCRYGNCKYKLEWILKLEEEREQVNIGNVISVDGNSWEVSIVQNIADNEEMEI